MRPGAACTISARSSTPCEVPGATAHCNHGPGVGLREYLDWRPFAYCTCRVTLPPRLARIVGIHRSIETYEFVPLDEHSTRIVMRVRLLDRPSRTTLRLRAFRRLSAAILRSWDAALLRIAEEDYAPSPQRKASIEGLS